MESKSSIKSQHNSIKNNEVVKIQSQNIIDSILFYIKNNKIILLLLFITIILLIYVFYQYKIKVNQLIELKKTQPKKIEEDINQYITQTEKEIEIGKATETEKNTESETDDETSIKNLS